MQFFHPTLPGRYVHSAAMRTLLGLDQNAKLPRGGMDARTVQAFDDEATGGPAYIGVKVWVNPLEGDAPKSERYPYRAQKRSTHRVRCECPYCGQEMSAGRLFQHICK